MSKSSLEHTELLYRNTTILYIDPAPPRLLLTLMITDEQIPTTVHRHYGSAHAVTVSGERRPTSKRHAATCCPRLAPMRLHDCGLTELRSCIFGPVEKDFLCQSGSLPVYHSAKMHKKESLNVVRPDASQNNNLAVCDFRLANSR